MSQLIGMRDGGKVTVPINGHVFNLNQVIIRVSENESAPIDYIAYRQIENQGEKHESAMP